MARSRNIKPGFFTNDELAELPALARLLFIGLWTIADREGRIEDRPKKIRAEVLPYDDCDPEALLQALHDRGFILRYAANGVNCIQVVNWAKHQNPHVKEQASTMAAPDMPSASTVQGIYEEKPCPEHAGLIPSSLIPDSSPLIPDSSDAGAKAPRADRGSRLAKDWKLPSTWGNWALEAYPHWNAEIVRSIGVKFGNHWKAKTGKDATKIDWELTWQNWVTSAITQRDFPPPTVPRRAGSLTDAEREALNAASDIEAKRLLFGNKSGEVVDA